MTDEHPLPELPQHILNAMQPQDPNAPELAWDALDQAMQPVIQQAQDDLEQGGITHTRPHHSRPATEPCPSGRPYPHPYNTTCQTAEPIRSPLYRALRGTFELPTVAALRQQLADTQEAYREKVTDLRRQNAELRHLSARLTTERDDLRQQLATMNRVAEGVDQMRATAVRRLDSLRTAACDLIDALDEGDIDTIGRIERLREAVYATTGETEETRMSLTPAAIEYLNDTRPATTDTHTFLRVPREDSSQSEEAPSVNSSDPETTVTITHQAMPVALDNDNYPTDSGETREPVTNDRYMMATRAFHQLGDLSRETPALAHITGEEWCCWVGSWVEGLGYLNIHFPKDTTRELTPEEIATYDGRLVQAGNGGYQIRIPRVVEDGDRDPDMGPMIAMQEWNAHERAGDGGQ